MKLLTVAALVVALTVAACAPVKSAYVIKDDPGGIIVDYLEKYSDISSSPETIVVDGACFSACTTFLGIVPPDRVCATWNAKLGFHSAVNVDAAGKVWHAYEMTALLWHLYPVNVRAALRARGWDGAGKNNAHPDIIVIKGRALEKLVRPCE